MSAYNEHLTAVADNIRAAAEVALDQHPLSSASLAKRSAWADGVIFANTILRKAAKAEEATK